MTLNSTIQRLPEHVINQIKAGEVIERPLNVVKELLENSLDAFATAIRIELLDGGKRLIQITDNGRGIPQTQISLAVERHTTSKLHSFEDLYSLQSFGFRGEALASIASISKLSIKTKTQSDELGTETIFENGLPIISQKVVVTTGTTITIKDIFQNVPARLKFLRTTATEFSLIQEFLIAISLAYPQISFCFVHNGRTVFDYKTKKNFQERFIEVINTGYENYVELKFEHGSLKISGFAILPEKITSPHNSLTTFVNGRFVKDRLIRSGIYNGYKGLLMKGVTPHVVLFLQMGAKDIDVNVHPAKTEIRFYDSLFVQDCISRAIEGALKENLNKKLYVTEEKHAVNFAKSTHVLSSRGLTAERRNEIFPRDKESCRSFRFNMTSPCVEADPVVKPRDDTAESLDHILKPRDDTRSNVLFEPEKSHSIFKNSKFLNQYADCYLIFQNEKDLWFVDQHAFHERILYEEVSKLYKENKIPKQFLLNPYVIKTNYLSAHVYEESLNFIQNLGFEIEILKNDQIAIHSFPIFLNEKYLENAFIEMMQKLCQQEVVNIGSLFHDCFATIACHSAIRAGESLNEDFVKKLMNRAINVDFFAHCPHGRPVIRKFSQNDVARWFERI